MYKNVGRRKYGAAVLTLAIGAAVLGALYIIFGFFISMYNSPDGYGFDFTHPNFFGAIDIVLTLASLALLIIFVIGIDKTPVLAMSMLTVAARILANFVSIIVYATQHQIEFVGDFSVFGGIIVFFVLVFAGRILLVNPAKIRSVTYSTIIVIVLNAVMLILNFKTYIEYVDEYTAVSSDYLIGSTIASSFYYLSQILMCLSTVLISRKLKPNTEVPELQLSN